ncbi:MAG: kelch repeat-containing protein [Planctomycetota bacterium]
MDRSVYVAGGWNLQGESSREAPWHEDMLRFDLDKPEAGWQSVPGPGYITRAASLAAHDGKVYLFGGIQQRGITRKVSVYDPKTETWSDGPELRPDSRAAGFATSSFAVGGELYVSGASGVVYRLGSDGGSWEVQDRLVYPRMFHRLLPVGSDRLIALGGTGSGGSGRMAVVESLKVDADLSNTGKLVQWSVPYQGRAKHSQSLVSVGNKLYAFGGNASWKPHDFRAESFVDEAFCFDVAQRSVEKLPTMPKALQNAMGVSHDKNSEHSTIVLAGGLGIGEDETFGALSSVFEFDPETDAWMTSQDLPSARGMASAVSYDEAIWMFGGSGKTHGLDSSIMHWWGDDSAIGSLPNTEVPHARRSFGGAVIGDEYFMVGGLGGGMSIEESTDVFNFETREWRSVASPSISRVFPTTCVVDGKLYLFGGFSNEGGHFEESPSLERYDPETNKWTMLAREIPGIDASMRLINMGGRLLFFGIDRDQEGIANFVLFDPDPTADPAEVAGMSFARRSGGGDAVRNAKMLMRRDADKDGKLSVDELGARMAVFIQRADSNGDQLVSFVEAKTLMEAEEEEEKEAPSAEDESESDATSEKADQESDSDSDATEITAEKAQAAADSAQREADAAQRAADAAQRKADQAQRLADSLSK